MHFPPGSNTEDGDVSLVRTLTRPVSLWTTFLGLKTCAIGQNALRDLPGVLALIPNKFVLVARKGRQRLSFLLAFAPLVGDDVADDAGFFRMKTS